MLALLGALDQFAPLVDADFRVDADGLEIGLQHLRADAGVGVGRAAAGAGPDGQLEAVLVASLGQQLPGFFRVMGPGVQLVIEAQQGGRVGRHGDAGVAFAVLRTQVGAAVEGEVDGLAYPHVVQRRVAGVDADVGDEQGVQFEDVQRRVLAQGGDVGGARVDRHLAGAGLELLHAHIGIGGDGEQQPVHRRLAGPIVRVGAEAHLGILAIALEDEGAGAHRLAIEPLRCAGLEQLVGVLGGIDGGEAHGEIGEEGCLGMFQGEAYAVVALLLDALDQLPQGHGFGVGEAARGQLVPGVVRVELALEAPEHIVGSELAAGREPGGGVELHALAQLEFVDQAVVADVPAFRQARSQPGTAGGEVHQAVEDGFGGGIGRSGGGVLDDIEAFGAGFGADHQGLVGCGVEGKAEGEGQQVSTHRASFMKKKTGPEGPVCRLTRRRSRHRRS
ncbi:hypothetical protein FQZ97_701310 [compost metagenome]